MSEFNELIDYTYSIKDQELFEDFFVGITTPQEQKALTQRFEIIKRLLDGEPQAKIAAELGVGVATVTRGSRELANGRFKAMRGKR